MSKFSGLFDQPKTEEVPKKNKFEGLFNLEGQRTQSPLQEQVAAPAQEPPAPVADTKAAAPESVESKVGAREVGKGVIGGLFELIPPVFGARIAGEGLTSLVDEDTRYAVTPSRVDYSMVPGLVHPTVDDYQAAKFNESTLNVHYQSAINDIKEGLSDFAVDLVPSLIDKDWKPHVENKAEKRGQEMVENYSMLPVQMIGFIPGLVGNAVSDATGDKFLGKSAELAAFGGVIKALHSRGASAKDIGEVEKLQREVKDAEPEGWVTGTATADSVILVNEEGHQIEVKKSNTDTTAKFNRKKQRAAKSESNKNELVRASESLRRKSEEERMALEVMQTAVEQYEGPNKAELTKLMADITKKVKTPEPEKPVTPTKELDYYDRAVRRMEERGIAPKFQPKPPPRMTQGAPVKGMSTGTYRFSKGKVFDPEGHRVSPKGKLLSISEGKALVEKLRKSERTTGVAEPGFARFDRAVVDRGIDFNSEIQGATNKGYTYEAMMKRLREVYYNMPKEMQANHRMRYNELLGKLAALEKSTRKAIPPISKEVVAKPHVSKDITRAAEIPKGPAKLELSQKTLPKERRRKIRPTRSEFSERTVPDIETLERDMEVVKDNIKYRQRDLEEVKKKGTTTQNIRKQMALEESIKDNQESLKLLEQRREELTTGRKIIPDPTINLSVEREMTQAERIFNKGRVERGAVPRSKGTVPPAPTGEALIPEVIQPGKELAKAQPQRVAKEHRIAYPEKDFAALEDYARNIVLKEEQARGKRYSAEKRRKRMDQVKREYIRASREEKAFVEGMGTKMPQLIETTLAERIKAKHENLVEGFKEKLEEDLSDYEYDSNTPIGFEDLPPERAEFGRGKVKRPTKKAPVVEDPEVVEAYNKAFGPGHVVQHTKMREGGNNLIPYPEELGRSAMIDNDGNMIVGKGSADSHRMIMEEIPNEMRSFYEKNRQTHQGWADDHNRFISIGDVGRAGGDVAEAYRMRYGDIKPTGEQAMKSAPNEPGALTGAQASEYAKKLDFGSGSEWDMTKDINGYKMHIKKLKGTDKAIISIDGLKISGPKPKKVVEAILRGLDNERGQAWLLNKVAFNVANTIKVTRDVLAYAGDELRRRFSPTTRGKQARATAAIIRHMNAKMDIANERLAGALKGMRSQMARWTIDQSVQFIDNSERGLHHLQPTPELARLSKQLSDALRANWDEVVALGGHKTVIEHYYPRYWDVNPGIIQRIKARRGITGAKTFQKGRKYDYFIDGYNDGLVPLSWNPIDHFLWKMQETNKFIAGQTIWNEMRANGFVRFIKAGDKHKIPHGWEELQDPIARVKQFDARNKAFIERGFFVAPDPVATIFNNYLNPGFYGTKSMTYRVFRYGNNLMNMAQLGLSAFHFMFTGLDSIASSVTTGMEYMQGGMPIRGAYHAATGLLPTTPFVKAWQGRRLRKAMYTIDPVNAANLEFITKTEMAGGGVALEKYYDLGAIKRMRDAYAQGRYVQGSLKAPAALIEYSSRWIMHHWVPNLKLAMAHDQFMMMDKVWEHKGIQPTLMERRIAYGKIWDSIDNRMGQLRYDNLFIDRKLKDAGMVFYRALGWNIGSIREFAGGILDAPKSFKAIVDRIATGKKPDFAKGDAYISRRMMYTAALLGVVIPAYTLALEWALTGKDLRQIVDDKDWHPWYARTGKIKPNGEEERVSLASYAKDVTSYLRDFPRGLLSTTGHKISPLLHYGLGLLENRKFNGEIIWDWDKSFFQYGGGISFDNLMYNTKHFAEYTGEHFLPFSFRNIQMRRESGGRFYEGMEHLTNVSPEDVRTFFGVVPAPAYATRSAAKAKAAELASRRWPKGPESHEAIERRRKKSKYITAYLTDNENMLDSVISSGEFTREQLRDAIKRAKTPSMALWLMALPMDDVMTVIRAMTSEEMKENKYYIEKKFRNNRSVPKDRLQILYNEYRDIAARRVR